MKSQTSVVTASEDDPRFAHIATDPKFKPLPKNKKRVKIDTRFKSLLTNKDFGRKTSIDKRGRPVIDASKRNKHVMERFYELSSSSEDEVNEKSRPKVKDKKKRTKESKKFASLTPVKDNEDESEDEPEQDSNSSVEESDEGSVSASSEDLEELPEFTDDYNLKETEVDHKWNELNTDASEVSESTRRLAVCNMDWDFVKAQDLFVLFKSFIPDGGRIKSVCIYPSEFGKERMAEEAMLGPKEIREANISKHDEGSKKKKKHIDQQREKREGKKLVSDQQEKLREYQLNRLKYYYAVVVCDSVKTADVIYSECDGREYQLSSVHLDLRFIPEDMTFDDEATDSFSEDQSLLDYQPNVFNSSALSQAKVEVTWDETDFDRLSKKVTLMQQKELENIVEENKFSEIIAPPESDSEEDDARPDWLKEILKENQEDELTEEDKIKKYRQIFMDKIKDDEDEEEKSDVDKEMKWTPGIKASVKEKLKKKGKEESGVVAEYLKKKKEKKKNKKRSKQLAEKEGAQKETFSDDELPEGVDLAEFENMMAENGTSSVNNKEKTNKSKSKKRKIIHEPEEEETISAQEKAELELMLLGESSSKKLKNKTDAESKNVKMSKKKKRKLALQKKKESGEADDFNLDVNDDRFSALYTSHHFHIDPSVPQYKKTKNMEKLVNEQIKRSNLK